MSYLTPALLPFEIFTEYLKDGLLRTLLDKGVFRYVENICVINTSKYITDDGKLTTYAKANLKECSLQFTQREIVNRHKKDLSIFECLIIPEKKEFFSPQYNQKSIDKAIQAVAACQQQIDTAQEFSGETVAQAIVRYMTKKKWQSSIFEQRTGLNATIYRKIMNNPDCKLELPVVISICIGLCLPIGHAQDLIAKAGYVLGKERLEDLVYSFLITGAVSDNIIACNAFIEEIEKANAGKIHKLGSHTYDRINKDKD